MGFKNTESSYGSVAKLFHWFMAVLILGMIISGNIGADMPISPEKTEVLWMHKSFGFLALIVIAARLCWRLINPPPKPVDGIDRPQRAIAMFVHGSMYFLLFIQPITGIIQAQSYGYPVPLFGLFDLPELLPVDEGMGLLFGTAHDLFWVLLVAAVIIHLLAALYHHFIRKDEVVRRMWFGGRQSK